MTKALIVGCAGPELTAEEADFLRKVDPWGFILFARNCPSPTAVEALVAAFRETVGREDAPVLIDQEGGRVQRLKPPYWAQYPCAADIGKVHARDPAAGVEAARLTGRLIAEDLRLLGITVDCLPLLDVRDESGHDVIGDRSFGSDPRAVAELGRALAEGLRAGGVSPVMKHLPGHGRAGADSHLELPRVDAPLEELRRVDFAPFHDLSDLPMAMTAHVLYTAIDAERCATISSKVIADVIRGEIGFDGLLMSDDLSMEALSGSLAERAEAAFAAGCDVALHCNGKLKEMREVASVSPELDGRAAERAEAAQTWPRRDWTDTVEARSELMRLLGRDEA
ncbi:beta-N-acetylhexosaminidase [Lutibaculum baratangense]|uniref:beta-N-acetylhexosaminidase n=1 Tax=Lutibaculum baratangense AMV1 TaxID=631454 RepID=V4RBL2_9HYPH|nr:beta-N-acetylhexosaminidase [Lutibaculum baratangense]ESR23541.1 Beta N-acetyl-glucosaminidase [Lutibaculum baratangense AMV1]